MNNSLMSKLVAQLKAQFPGKVISKSQLRSEVATVNGQGQFSFEFKKNKPNPSVTELPYLLKDNDLFVVLYFKFFIAVRDSANPALYVKQTFPNTTVFVADGAGGAFLPEHLEALYNAAYLKYKKGDSDYMPALNLGEARFVGQTQQTSATNKTSTELNDGGIITIPQPLDIIGTDAGEFLVNLPGSNTLTGLQYSNGGTKSVIMILEAHGALVSGGNKIVAGAATV